MSWASTPGARRSMQANRGRDTTPELRVRKLLHAAGARYRVDLAPLGGRRRADIVFSRRRIAVYIDGCFWHGCPQHATYPRTNSDYWLPKLKRNVERDRETDSQLRQAGWTVLRYWEHEAPEQIVRSILERIERDREVRSRT
ncbi:very short patch repair endonuclease [Naasia sp. SYSU D00057]|uniref:very short patch repair endonuclease n=1 Tax=Naasia sp. SYSU D00057 TaxID=2817380 RepID=UPI0024A71DE1|nr:very short patch repair endonuclease [Naasia sp. SYSU D00057]